MAQPRLVGTVSFEMRTALRARLLGAAGAALVLGGCGPDRVEQRCIQPQGGVCLTAEQVEYTLEQFDSECSEVNGVEGPTRQDGACCYDVGFDDGDCEVIDGRPLLIEGRAVMADLHRGAYGWGGDRGGAAPPLGDVDDVERALLAEAWARSAVAEHSSVASFARVAMELMAVGAPAELVAGAHRAALDEIRHAELCFALASRYGGATLGPAPLSLGGAVELRDDLVSLAATTVHEGCVNETLAAALAAEQRLRCQDPEVAAALAIIAADEAGHAELAWRTVAWAIAAGGERVRAAVAEAFASALRAPPSGFEAGGDTRGANAALLEAHGVLDCVLVRELLARTMRDVVAPCARRLLVSSAPAPLGALAGVAHTMSISSGPL